MANKYFSVIPSGPNPPPVHTVEPVQNGLREVAIRTQSQPIELIGYKRPDQLSPDDPVFDVISEILSGGRTGTIYKSLVRDKKLALGAGAAPRFPVGQISELVCIVCSSEYGQIGG